MSRENEEIFHKANINWYPGHMAKTKREIENDLKLIDVVIELLDARIPHSSRNPDFKKMTQNKKRIIVLNKSDIADEKITKMWQDYYSKEAVTIIADSNSGKGLESITKKIDNIMSDEVAKQAERGRINKTIRVMVLGIPNVGKSSFINRVSKKTVMEVGNKPGVTKAKKWIRISGNQELLDTPGVLWPKFESETQSLNLAFTGSIKDEILEIVEIAYEFLKRNYADNKEKFLSYYKISNEEAELAEKNSNSIYALMKLIGRKRGALIKGNEVDDEKVSRIILDDFRNAKIGRISLEKPNEK